MSTQLASGATVPADFLIDADGTIVAAHYGRHADDQWSVDESLGINASLGGTGSL